MKPLRRGVAFRCTINARTDALVARVEYVPEKNFRSLSILRTKCTNFFASRFCMNSFWIFWIFSEFSELFLNSFDCSKSSLGDDWENRHFWILSEFYLYFLNHFWIFWIFSEKYFTYTIIRLFALCKINFFGIPRVNRGLFTAANERSTERRHVEDPRKTNSPLY